MSDFVRGDTKEFCFKIKNKSTAEYIDGSSYTEIECQFNGDTTINSVKKLKSKNEVSWDSTNSCFVCELTQEDTFKLSTGLTKLQVRLFVNDDCKGTTITSIDVGEVLSSEVLE